MSNFKRMMVILRSESGPNIKKLSSSFELIKLFFHRGARLLVIISLYCFILFYFYGCASSPRFYSGKKDAVRPDKSSAIEEGVASFYAEEFNGRKTSNGEIYDMHALTAAHPSHPFNTRVKVTNLDNGKTVIVRINDRGPFVKNRIIDLSYMAAKELNMIGPGTANVRVEVIEWGPKEPKSN